MKLLKKIQSFKLSKTLAAVAVGGILFFGTGDALANKDDNAESEFRRSYLSVPFDNRSINQSVVFFGTTFHLDINCVGNVLRDAAMEMSGNMNWDYTNPSNNITTNNTMPFYIVQNDKELIFYVQRNKEWGKFLFPAIPASFVNALKSNDISILTENLKAVKNVELFRNTDAQQIFDVTLSGQYLAGKLESYKQESNTAGISTEEFEAQQTFICNLQAALQKTDVMCTWTLDKIENRTVTAVINFTDLMRAFAKNLLEESAAGRIVLTENELMLLDTIGYYSEFHYSFSYTGEKITVDVPADATKAPVNNNILRDLVKGMTSTAKN